MSFELNNMVNRFSRQILLPEVGIGGQKLLAAARVLIVGCGGLGCPSALYLAAGGVGHLGLVDGDTVALDNLHRQIAFKENNIGSNKAEMAAVACLNLNASGGLTVTQHLLFLTVDNILEIVNKYDVILDCTDNVATRYLINDACVLAGKPLISASALRWEGQLTVYDSRPKNNLSDLDSVVEHNGPCYRCLFPDPPPAAAVGSCSANGVIGPVVGVMGSLQALEAIKFIIGTKDLLVKRLLLFDGLNMSFRVVQLRSARPDCAVCGKNATITALNILSAETAVYLSPTITCVTPLRLIDPSSRVSAQTFSKMRNSQRCVLIDVRPKHHFDICHIDGALNIPLGELPRRFSEVVNHFESDCATEKCSIVTVCRRGNDSQRAVLAIREQMAILDLEILSKVSVIDIVGGLTSWKEDVDGEDARNGDKDSGDLPQPGPSYALENDEEANIRRYLVNIAVRVFCVGRLRITDFPVSGESRSLPYEGYDNDTIERRLIDEFDSLMADSLFDGDVEALRAFSTSSSPIGTVVSQATGAVSNSPVYTVCGRLFKQQDVVYSCRDCALDNTCVLCAACFAQSVHTSHNYRMHASGGGGYCDCGDVEAWHRDPACRLHMSGDSASGQSPSTGAMEASTTAKLPTPERSRSFLRYIMRFVEQILTAPMDLLPADLHEAFAKAYPSALSAWITVLFNDEVHSFDEVIRTLRYAVSCSSSMAENFASAVDKRGRAVIFYGRQSACASAAAKVSQRSAQENPKRMSLRVVAASFAAFQLQELAVSLVNTTVLRLLNNWPDMQKIMLNEALAGPCIQLSEVYNLADTPDQSLEQKLVVDSLLLANSSLWKTARSATHQLFMATAFSLPECRRRFGLFYARNYSQIMRNFVEKDFHHYKDSIVSLSVQLFTVPSLVVAIVEQLDFVVKIAEAIRSAIEPAISSETGIVPSSEHLESEAVPSFLLEHMAETVSDIEYILRSLPPEPPVWSVAVEDAVLRGFVAFVHQVMLPFTGTDALTRRVGEHVEWDPVLTNAFAFFDAVHPALYLFYTRLVSVHKVDRLKTALSLVRPTLSASLRSLNCFNVHQVKVELGCGTDFSGNILPPPKQRKAEQFGSQRGDLDSSAHVSQSIIIVAPCVASCVATDPVSLHIGVPRVIYDLMGGAAELAIEPWSLLCGTDMVSDDLNPTCVVEPALRVLVYQAQVQAGMWRRNGLAVAQQIAFYRHHSETCHQFDLDLLAVQLAGIAPTLTIDQLLVQIVDKFNLIPWLTGHSADGSTQPKMKPITDIIARYGASLIDELLVLLVNILMERYRPGVSENLTNRDCLRYRLIQKLATGPQPHSQLREWLLTHNDDSESEPLLESLLLELAETRSRPTDGRTLFDLKAEHLSDFNPFTTYLDRTELARAEQHVREGFNRQQNRSGSTSSAASPVIIVPLKLPPFSAIFRPLLNIFSSPVFIEITKIVLSKALKRDNALHQDSHVDKALFLLAIAAVEQRRPSGGLPRRLADIPDFAAILDILVQLNQRTSILSSSQPQTSSPQPGELSRSQLDLVAWLVRELVPAKETQDASSGVAAVLLSEDEEETKANFKQKSDIAQQHRSKLMAKMAKLQRNFLENHPELADFTQNITAVQASAVVASPMETESRVASNIVQQMFDSSCKDAVCMVCQDACRPASINRSTSVTASQQHLVVPGGSAPDITASTATIACFVACVQRCYALAQKNVSVQVPAAYLSVCGHPIHSYCWQRYTESQQARPRHRFLPGMLAALFGSVRGQPLTSTVAPCPLCETLGNAVIPLVDVRSFLPNAYPLSSVSTNSPSVLADACRLLLTITDPDERDYLIVSNHRTNPTLTSPFSGSAGHTVSNAVTSYGRMIANVLVAQATAQLSGTGAAPPAVKIPTSPDELTRSVASAVAHTGRCIVAVILTFNAADLTDENGVFSGAVRRHLDCLVAASQAGVALTLISADSFCAVNILRIVSCNLINALPAGGASGDATGIQFTAPALIDGSELLAQLWLLEPLIRTGLQSPDSSATYILDAFWLCFLLEAARTLSALANGIFDEEGSHGYGDIESQSLIRKIWSSVSPKHISMPAKKVVREALYDTLVPFLRLMSLLASAILNKQLSLQAFTAEVPDICILCKDALGCDFNRNPIEMLFEDLAGADDVTPNSSILEVIMTRFRLISGELTTASALPDARRLVYLPSNYADLLSRAAAFTCPSLIGNSSQSLSAVVGAASSSQQPVLCLLCDSMICGASCEHCIRRMGLTDMSEASTGTKPNAMLIHAIACSGGRGLFLRLHDCCLLIIADASGRTIKHPPPYTDRYGEPDPGLRRGGPLILSKQRYAEVERLWLGHGLADIAYKYFASGRSAAADLIFAGLDPGALAMVGLDPAGLL